MLVCSDSYQCFLESVVVISLRVVVIQCLCFERCRVSSCIPGATGAGARVAYAVGLIPHETQDLCRTPATWRPGTQTTSLASGQCFRTLALPRALFVVERGVFLSGFSVLFLTSVSSRGLTGPCSAFVAAWAYHESFRRPLPFTIVLLSPMFAHRTLWRTSVCGCRPSSCRRLPPPPPPQPPPLASTVIGWVSNRRHRRALNHAAASAAGANDRTAPGQWESRLSNRFWRKWCGAGLALSPHVRVCVASPRQVVGRPTIRVYPPPVRCRPWSTTRAHATQADT